MQIVWLWGKQQNSCIIARTQFWVGSSILDLASKIPLQESSGIFNEIAFRWAFSPHERNLLLSLGFYLCRNKICLLVFISDKKAWRCRSVAENISKSSQACDWRCICISDTYSTIKTTSAEKVGVIAYPTWIKDQKQRWRFLIRKSFFLLHLVFRPILCMHQP